MAWFARHRGKLVGSALGLVVGLSVMAWGVLWTLFLALLVLVGYTIGRYVDGAEDPVGERLERWTRR